MTDYSELKRLAEAFPADLDWDSNTEPFFNGPSGESLGGGPTGFYCVYGPAFEIDDEQYDGPTYVESCKVDFAKFMVAAREGVLALIADLDDQALQTRAAREVALESQTAILQLLAERDQLKADNEALRREREGKVLCDLELFETLRDAANTEADQHRQCMATYRPLRQENLDSVVKKCDDLLAAMGKVEQP